MNCENCGEEVEELYELVECKNCEKCWMEYWQSENIGLDTSFKDFLNYTCSPINDTNCEENVGGRE